jgi:hypothetical protein
VAAPMIADIFKEVYKSAQANGRRTSPPIRRAQAVEEDESD